MRTSARARTVRSSRDFDGGAMQSRRTVGKRVTLGRVLHQAFSVVRADHDLVPTRARWCPDVRERHPVVPRQHLAEPRRVPRSPAVKGDLDLADAARARVADAAYERIRAPGRHDRTVLGQVEPTEGAHESVLVPTALLPVPVVWLRDGHEGGQPLRILDP